MSDLLEALRTPFTCKSLTVHSRIAMAPMTRYQSPDGLPGPAVLDYYRRRAENDVGLIITEGVGIERAGARPTDDVPNFFGEQALDMWQDIAEAVHTAGAAIAPQLWHIGGVPDISRPDAHPAPLESPSGLIGPDHPGGHVMSEEDIADTIAAYARAAGEARRLGFDAVEVHAAHGYLIDQFFWDATNKRGDAYGGASLRERARFGAEICAAIRKAVGEDFTLIMRVSQWKTNWFDTKIAKSPGDFEEWLGPLADAGADIFHCSQRRFWEPEFDGSDLNMAGWVKKIVGKPTITVGSVGLNRDVFADFDGTTSHYESRLLQDLVRRFERGDFDLVALGRVLLADPLWSRKVREGRYEELQPYSAEAMSVYY